MTINANTPKGAARLAEAIARHHDAVDGLFSRGDSHDVEPRHPYCLSDKPCTCIALYAASDAAFDKGMQALYLACDNTPTMHSVGCIADRKDGKTEGCTCKMNIMRAQIKALRKVQGRGQANGTEEEER